MKINRTYYKTREEFLAIRETFHAEHRLGGSEVGTAAGQNKWKSRRRLYEEMVGNIETPDISNKQAVKDGMLCEEIVAKKFEERTGKKVHRENCVMTSDAAPHLFASIDRKVDNEDAGLECKTATALNWDAFKDGRLPDSYVKQVKSYLKVTGLTRWYVYVWVMGVAEYCYIFTTDGQDLDNPPAWADAVYFVSEMELDEVEEIADAFMVCVERHIAPACDGSEDETELLKEMFGEGVDGKVANILSVTEADLKELDCKKMWIKEYEEAIKTIENRIRDAMGDASEAMIGDRKVTWKNNKNGLRVLRIGKAK